MKIAAVGVTSSDLKATVKFYEVLGYKFPEFGPNEDHVEPVVNEGETRLMIDSKKLIKSISGKDPKPANQSAFAIEFESPADVDEVAGKVKAAGYEVVKEPWNAFWRQRYAIVADPDGYMIDLYARL